MVTLPPPPHPHDPPMTSFFCSAFVHLYLSRAHILFFAMLGSEGIKKKRKPCLCLCNKHDPKLKPCTFQKKTIKFQDYGPSSVVDGITSGFSLGSPSLWRPCALKLFGKIVPARTFNKTLRKYGSAAPRPRRWRRFRV